MNRIKNVCDIFICELKILFGENRFGFALYGSAAMDDFQDGFSDIDILVLTEDEVSKKQADTLLYLRQKLVDKYNEPFFRLLEGVIVNKDAFFNEKDSNAVYWGTGGERITDKPSFMPFDIICLKEYGQILYGSDFKYLLNDFSPDTIRKQIIHTYNTVKQHGVITESKKSAGWFSYIARSLFTLETGKITSKSAALCWAAENNHYTDALLRLIISIRQGADYTASMKNSGETIASLDQHLKSFNKVLESWLGI